MSNVETIFWGMISLLGFFATMVWFRNSEREDEDYYDDENKKYMQLQDQALNSISTISDNKKSVEKVTEIHHHHKTENHYHVYQDGGKVRSERVINPKKLLGEN